MARQQETGASRADGAARSCRRRSRRPIGGFRCSCYSLRRCSQLLGRLVEIAIVDRVERAAHREPRPCRLWVELLQGEQSTFPCAVVGPQSFRERPTGFLTNSLTRFSRTLRSKGCFWFGGVFDSRRLQLKRPSSKAAVSFWDPDVDT